jgi:hypothetical protein
MKTPWQIAILDALEALDRKEEPHGLYGVRQAYSTGGRLPKLAHLLSSPGRTDILRCNGFRSTQSRFASHDIWFSTEDGDNIVLQLLDYATTKVRHYGSSYRVDERHTKKPKEPDWELESLVPKLSTKQRTCSIRGILLIVHYRQEKELVGRLGRSADADFLGRYQVSHVSRCWQDRYRRDFSTAIHLWSAQKRACVTMLSPGMGEPDS